MRSAQISRRWMRSSGTGELEAILAAAGIGPASDSPFRILPQDFAQPSVDAHTQKDLALLDGVPVGETSVMVSRAASAVQQHSRPLADERVAPQLQIAQSLAETGTTTDHVNHTGEHVAHVPLQGRAEGFAREQAGRFSREAWDGATAALPDYLYSDATPRILTTPRASAYIKIAEGCDHPCSFCIIPQLRGKFRSRRMGSIIAEAQNLIAQGVREITLIGQDTTCYGEDLGLKEGLAQLLDALAVLPGTALAALFVHVPEQGDDAAARNDGAARHDFEVPGCAAAACLRERAEDDEAGRQCGDLS